MADALPTLIPFDEVDPALVEQLLDRAFGPVRHKRTAYAIREGTEWLPALSFAVLDDKDLLVGTIQAWPVALTASVGADNAGTDRVSRPHPLIMVGPVAISPERQGDGFGRALMAAQSTALDPAAPLPQMLIGDMSYYARFGFVEAPRGWRCPGPWEPERLLVRAPNPAVLPQEGMLGPWRM